MEQKKRLEMEFGSDKGDLIAVSENCVSGGREPN